MDYSTLIRDKDKVHACLIETPSKQLIASKECKIYIPQRFEQIGLASIGVETHIVGLYAIVFEDRYYAVCSVNAMMRITPSKTEKIKIGHVDYFEFTFNEGSVIVPNMDLVKRDILTYYIYDEIFSAGRVPWYITYDDLGSIFDTAADHAGANIGKNREITEMLVSLISRDQNDRSQFFRINCELGENVVNSLKPSYIPLKSVIFSATNTTNKLAGAYMQHGVVSALVTPSEKTERIEALLRT